MFLAQFPRFNVFGLEKSVSKSRAQSTCIICSVIKTHNYSPHYFQSNFIVAERNPRSK